jgi:hypothetical protein
MSFKLLLKLLVVSNVALGIAIAFMSLCVGLMLWYFFKALYKYFKKQKLWKH